MLLVSAIHIYSHHHDKPLLFPIPPIRGQMSCDRRLAINYGFLNKPNRSVFGTRMLLFRHHVRSSHERPSFESLEPSDRHTSYYSYYHTYCASNTTEKASTHSYLATQILPLASAVSRPTAVPAVRHARQDAFLVRYKACVSEDATVWALNRFVHKWLVSSRHAEVHSAVTLPSSTPTVTCRGCVFLLES